MPIRFSTEAANADHMRMETPPGVPEGMPDDIGADGTPRDRADRSAPSNKGGAQREPRGGAARDKQAGDTTARPRKDKDKDAGKP